jgi:uncharacterized protein (TIGR03083 family)
LRAEATAFEQYLAGLSEADLARPSACDGWTNADAVAHLTWAAQFFGDILERALRGDVAPPPSLPPQGSARRQRIADLARELKSELGESLPEAFAGGNRSLEAAFAGVRAEDWDRPAAHRTGSVRRLAQTRLNELAVHGWDIRSKLDPPGHLTDSSLPVLIDLISRWLELLFTPDPTQKHPWRLRFEYPTANIADRDLVIGPSQVSFAPASGDPADLIVRAHPEVTILLAIGRIDPASAIETYGGTASGRTELLGLLRSRFGAI